MTHSRLNQRTTACHVALEARLGALMSDDVSLDDLHLLEGSTLGGKFITGYLKRVLALDETRGCSSFNSYGTDTSRMWSRFVTALTNHCEKHGDDEIILNSACQIFAAMDRWFSHAG
jgi:heme oxygenase